MNFSRNCFQFVLLNLERAFQDICDRGGTVIEEKAHGKYKTNRRQSHTISRSGFFLSDFLSIEVITKNVLWSPRGQTSVAGFPAAFIFSTDQLKFWNLIVFMVCVFVLLYFILFCFAWGGKATAPIHGKCKKVGRWMVGMPDFMAFACSKIQIWKWNQTLPLAPWRHLAASETFENNCYYQAKRLNQHPQKSTC